MICFPNAKINLGLHIVEKRQDGFHNIDTLMYPINYCDVLEIKPSTDFKLQLHGIAFQEQNEINILSTTWRLLHEKYAIPPIEIHLFKSIPIGSGLGGGSADAAFLIKMVNEYFGLGLNKDDLKRLASQVGSDCPFFVDNNPAFVSGRGENLEHVKFSLSGKFFVLVVPKVNCSTKEAYELVRPAVHRKSIREIVTQPIQTWKEDLINDFESPIFEKYPQIEEIKRELYINGAIYASMTGSGSAVYGIFEKEVPTNTFSDSFIVWSAYL